MKLIKSFFFLLACGGWLYAMDQRLEKISVECLDSAKGLYESLQTKAPETNRYRCVLALARRQKFLDPCAPTALARDFVKKNSLKDILTFAVILYYQRMLSMASQRVLEASAEKEDICFAAITVFQRMLFSVVVEKLGDILRFVDQPFRAYLYPTLLRMEAEVGDIDEMLEHFATSTKEGSATDVTSTLKPRLGNAEAWYELYSDSIDVFYNQLIDHLMKHGPDLIAQHLVYDVDAYNTARFREVPLNFTPEECARRLAVEESRRVVLAQQLIVQEEAQSKTHKRKLAKKSKKVHSTPDASHVCDEIDDAQTDAVESPETVEDRVAQKGLDEQERALQNESQQSVGVSSSALATHFEDLTIADSSEVLQLALKSPIQYDDRVLWWHTDISKAFADHGEVLPSSQFWGLVKHRIPLILESEYGHLARHSLRKRSDGRHDVVFYFDGWIEVFGGSVCIPGTFEVTRDPQGIFYHRFFRVNCMRDHSVPVASAASSEHAILFIDEEHRLRWNYLVTETDTYVRIAEPENPYDVRYVICKKSV